MAELLIQNAQSPQQRRDRPDPHFTRKTSFKYYIHDSISALKLQLIGDLSASDVAGLNGTWDTAKTTLGCRQLLLDLRQLHRADEEGQVWLDKMKNLGAFTLPSHLGLGIAESGPHGLVRDESVKLSLLSRVLALFRSPVARPEL